MQTFETAAQGGHHLANPLTQAGIDRDHGLHGAAGQPQIGVVIAVDHRLVVHCRMDGRGYAVLDPVMLVEQVEDGNDAVDGAGAAGDDPMAGF